MLSFRVTHDERARLERDAAGLSMSDFFRSRLLGDAVQPRRTRGQTPVKDHVLIAQLLGKLGKSGLSRSYTALADGVCAGRLEVSKETEFALQEACADIKDMRAVLLRALGLGYGNGS